MEDAIQIRRKEITKEAALLEAPSWSDWRWQTKNAIRTVEQLEQYFVLTDEEREGATRAVEQGFPLSITPYYASLCDTTDSSCPIRMQCVPQIAEEQSYVGDLRDPLGEESHEVAPHLVQRYPDRILLLATDHCSVYCRFCTRSRMVGSGEGARSLKKLEQAFLWIESHPEIHDVLISGGDPLLMSDERIVQILERIRKIEHVYYVRLATRAPVTIPQRVTQELCSRIRKAHPSVWLMTHFNHPKEITGESMKACHRFADAGMPVMNQTVLLKGINDQAKVLELLFRKLVQNRVRPYYLLQCDPVGGSGHLRTPISQGLEIMEALQGRVSGIALPKFIVDTPDGKGKVPLQPNYLERYSEGIATLRTFRNERVNYVDPCQD